MLNSINDVQTLIAGIIRPEHTVYLPNIIGVTQRDLKDYITKVELASKLNGYVTKENLNDYVAANKKYIDRNFIKTAYPPENNTYTVEGTIWADYLGAMSIELTATKIDNLGIHPMYYGDGEYYDLRFPRGVNGTLLTEEKADEKYLAAVSSDGAVAISLGRSGDYNYLNIINSETHENVQIKSNGTISYGQNRDLYKVHIYDIQLKKNYRHIETITLTEDTKIIERSQEPNGKAYNFKDMFIAFSCTDDMPAGSVTNSKEWVKCWFNYGEKKFSIFRETTLGRADSTAKYCSFIKTENEGNLKRSIMAKGYINYGYSNSETQADGNLEWLFTTNNLTKIKLEHQSKFLAGIVIEIWATNT